MIRIDAAQAHFCQTAGKSGRRGRTRVFVINPAPQTLRSEPYCPPDVVEDTDTALKFGNY